MPAPGHHPAGGRHAAVRPRRPGRLPNQRRNVPALTLLDLASRVYPTYQWARHHRQIADALTDVAKGKTRRLLISVHPQSGKSTLVRLFLSWLLMSDPAKKLLLLSYSKRLAAAHSVAARDITRHFGRAHVAVTPDSRARDLWRTTRGGYVLADSAQGAVSGFSADGVCYDDPIKGADEAASEAIRESTWETFSSVVETRLAPAGWVVIISTAWHPEALPQRLARDEGDRWAQLVLPALDADENPLWPERYNKAWYLQR